MPDNFTFLTERLLETPTAEQNSINPYIQQVIQTYFFTSYHKKTQNRQVAQQKITSQKLRGVNGTGLGDTVAAPPTTLARQSIQQYLSYLHILTVCTSKNGTFFLYFCHYSLLTLVTKNIYAELGNKLLEKRPFMPLPPYLCLSRWSLLLPRDCQILFCFVNSFRGSFKAFRLTLHEQRLQQKNTRLISELRKTLIQQQGIHLRVDEGGLPLSKTHSTRWSILFLYTLTGSYDNE